MSGFGLDGLAAPGLAAMLLAVAGVALFLAAAHPFVTYPLSLLLLARLRPRPIRLEAEHGTRQAALCVCAYNEAAVIRAKVENMLLMRDAVPALDILVYVDAATDGTAEILRQYEDRLRLVVSPVRMGKTHGMNLLVGLADADYVVFSDANVAFAPDAVPALLAPFQDQGVGAVCGHLHYTAAGGSATAATGLRYWQHEEGIKALESATGSVMGADGSIFAIRRALHVPPPPDLIDDMYVSLAVLCAGARIVRAADALAYEDAVSRPAEEFRRKVRIACQAFNVHRVLWPRLRRLPLIDRYKYVSHKLLRWMTGYLLVASGACVFAALVAAGGWALGAAAAVLGGLASLAVWRARRGKLAALRDVAGAFLATAVGVWRSLRGDRFQTWTPPGSARTMPAAPTVSRGVTA